MLDRLASLLLDRDPFVYFVATVLSLVGWLYMSVIADLALAGAGVTLRRLLLLAAAVSAVLFFEGLGRLP